jgi:flagellar hook-associated protein 1
LKLAGLQVTDILDNGTVNYQGAYGQLVASAGTQTRQAEISSSALGVLKEQALAARNEVSGVNLDEEAAKLLQFQQAYQASAQAISIANTIFESLLQAVR